MKVVVVLLTNPRHYEILNAVKESKSVSVNDLAVKLNVSTATIRTDLNHLDEEGLLTRVHGGAIELQDEQKVYLSAVSFIDRKMENHEEKREIAVKAFKFIRDNQCIILDSSSTSYELAELINESSLELMVMTNGLRSAELLKENPRITTILIGGTLRGNTDAVGGILGADILDKINIDTAFLSPRAFSLEKGMTNFNLDEVELKKKMVDKAQYCIGLVDNTKLDKNSIASFASFSDIDILVTDNKANQIVINKYISKGLQVI